MRADGEDYSVFRQKKVPPSELYPDVTPQEADEIRAAFREKSRNRLRIPRIAMPSDSYAPQLCQHLMLNAYHKR